MVRDMTPRGCVATDREGAVLGHAGRRSPVLQTENHLAPLVSTGGAFLVRLRRLGLARRAGSAYGACVRRNKPPSGIT
jgi:hypothetical protein